MIQHVEIWEHEKQVFNGPETSVMSTRWLDERTFSTLTLFRSLARVREYGGAGVDVVISTNYSMGMAGLLLKLFGKTRKSVVVLSDYLPPRGPVLIRIHRRVSAALMRFVARHSDEVWTVSPRIPAAVENPNNHLLPICINDNHVERGLRQEIGYIGFPSEDHALDILFEIAHKHGIRLNIIGKSPYLDSIRSNAPADTVFHGVLNDQEQINQIMSRCFCGYAVYRNAGPQSYSYFGIPSKTFYFLASNTPAVTTDTAHFSKTLQQNGVAEVVAPSFPEIEAAILKLRAEFNCYFEAIDRFRIRWNSHCVEFHRTRLMALGYPIQSSLPKPLDISNGN
jgi:hypothetical protein